MKIESMNISNQTKEDMSMKEHMRGLMMGRPGHPVPPHERKGMITIQFDDRDWKVFTEVFGDEDTAAAAADIIHSAPPEIQILAAQILKMIEKEEA